MYEDGIALTLLYNQAVEDIRRGRVKPGNKIQEIKELKNSNNKRKVRVMKTFLRLLSALFYFLEKSFIVSY